MFIWGLDVVGIIFCRCLKYLVLVGVESKVLFFGMSISKFWVIVVFLERFRIFFLWVLKVFKYILGGIRDGG